MGNVNERDPNAKEGEHQKEKKHKKVKQHKKRPSLETETEAAAYSSFVNNFDVEAFQHEITDDISKFYDVGDEILGMGNFSMVKLGTNKKTGEKCAVKIVSKEPSKNKPQMLKNEVEILLKVRHPNIIKLKDLFDSSKTLFLVLELVTGGELFDSIVAREQYSEEDAVRVMKELLSAIEYLHSMGIVHRDLKPENLLLSDNSPNSPIKLADFGLSKIYSPEMMQKMSTACGTPGYVAPEILDPSMTGSGGYDKEVDMWSAGVVMYILLCGYPPFYNEVEQQLFEIILSGKYEFHSPYWDNISDTAKDLIKHLLVVDPKKRFTANEALQHDWFTKAVVSKVKTKSGIHTAFKSQLTKHNTYLKQRKDTKTTKQRTTYSVKEKDKK
eukprot:TRINITY_DN709_c0_g1_i1.p1 TRINITY_DN709_c0_g1~~TRINITY_DN709_c0_g1_i1.p1  ORF type:complete len:384 (+),score=83.20 TRINITY_DN709_c0_g1_i1:103-1254(+)